MIQPATFGEKTQPPRGYGLDGVIVADTEISDVDGTEGRLLVRGYPIEDLAGNVSFEAMLALLTDGQRPGPVSEQTLSRALGIARSAAHTRLPGFETALALADPMDALRASVALLPSIDDESQLRLNVTATIAVSAAAWWRRQLGQAACEPDPELSHAADYLRIATGATAPELVQALDTYLVTVAEHGMNASSFAVRVVTSTGSDTISAITAGLSALKGPLHGGAPGPVLDMLDAIQTANRAQSYLEAELARGVRIMGMGHRVYRVRDPRAEVLERATRALGSLAPESRIALAKSVECVATRLLASRYPDRPLCANVEFFTAVLLEAIGIPRALFTPTFAVARVAGYLAHVSEQRRTGRIMRPGSRYVGVRPPRMGLELG